jgi:hypothetical protein
VQPTASTVLKQSKPPLLERKPTEEPLSPREVAAMKQHFQFLKRHRKTLRLNLNAQEDLLLNGAREPTHRGVCKHLLGKLDKARVLTAVERLPAAEGTQLLEGIVRFSPDVTYLLLYLECVQKSAAQKEATAALGVALGQLDFGDISEAQMRKVLHLISQVFSASQVPQVLFGLLKNSNFRQLFDSSQDGLPDELARVVLPLRAAHAVVLQDRPNPCSLTDLRAGVQFLVQAPRAALLAHPPPVRERLFSLALEATHGMTAPVVESLRVLLGSLEGGEPVATQQGMALAVWLLVEGKTKDAKRLLTQLGESHPKFKEPSRWLRALGDGRDGRDGRDASILLFSRPRGRDGGQASSPPSSPSRSPEPSRLVEGFSLKHGCPVYVVLGDANESADSSSLRDLSRVYELSGASGIASFVESGSGKFSGKERPYLAVRRPARLMTKPGKDLRGNDRREFRNRCRDVATSVHLLTARGVTLLGIEPRRLGLDGEGRLWLIDLSGAKVDSSSAGKTNPSLPRRWLLQMANGSTRHLPTADWVSAVEAASDCAALVACIDR